MFNQIQDRPLATMVTKTASLVLLAAAKMIQTNCKHSKEHEFDSSLG